MPEILEILNRQAQQLAAQAMGMRADQPRVTVGEVRGGGFEGDILAMPQGIIDPLQNSDGDFFFLVDVSLIDGPDIL